MPGKLMNEGPYHLIVALRNVNGRPTKMEAIYVCEIELDSTQIPSVSCTPTGTAGEKGGQDPRINPRGELPKAVLGPTGGKPR